MVTIYRTVATLREERPTLILQEQRFVLLPEVARTRARTEFLWLKSRTPGKNTTFLLLYYTVSVVLQSEG